MGSFEYVRSLILHIGYIGPQNIEPCDFSLNPNRGRSGCILMLECLLPMWAQTYQNGRTYYREQKGSRGTGYCVGNSWSMPCHVPDEQIGRIVGAIVLPDAWMDRVLAKIHFADEVIRPKPAFTPLFEIATTRQGSDVVLINEPPQAGNEPEAGDLCFWWRRGRDELHQPVMLIMALKQWKAIPAFRER